MIESGFKPFALVLVEGIERISELIREPVFEFFIGFLGTVGALALTILSNPLPEIMRIAISLLSIFPFRMMIHGLNLLMHRKYRGRRKTVGIDLKEWK